MADYTQNYNLIKPTENDFYNIDDFNDNADIIDEALNDKLNSDFSNVSGGAVPIENGGTGATTSASARTNLGVMARDFSNASTTLPISKGGTGSTTASSARTNLGVMARDFSNASSTLSISKGGTGATSVSSARTNFGLDTSSLATEIQSLLTGGNISMIKSIQKGTIHAESQTCTVTINTVNTNKSIIINTGSTFHYEEGIGMLELINSNTIQVTKRINKSSLSIYVGFEVIEFY